MWPSGERARVLTPKARRRLLRLGYLAVAGAAGVLVVTLMPTAHGLADRRAEEARRLAHPVPAVEASPPARAIVVTPELRRQVEQTMTLFVETAVRREHLERAWPIVDPSLRAGLTRAQWKTGSIPVVPFPALRIRFWRIASATTDSIQAEVVLAPQPGSGLLAKTFYMELRRAHARGHSAWRVSYWVPEGISVAQMNLDARKRSHHNWANRLSSVWLLVPFGLLALTIITPVALLTSQVIADRRAERRYLQHISR